MADVIFTERQEQAISSRGRTLLVSAAAGSGKTATLTERIIRRLCDKDAPADITRFLIVTFTRKAASELREKIRKAIMKRLEGDPTNRALSMQLMKLPSARISTIDSFCYDIVRHRADALGLPSGIRIADENECDFLSRKVMDALISDYYDSTEDQQRQVLFSDLSECLTNAKSETTLADQFLSLYRRLRAYPEGVSGLSAAAGSLSDINGETYFDTPYGKILREMTQKRFDGYEEKLTELRDAMRRWSFDNGGKPHPYAASVENNLVFFRSLAAAIERSYDETRRVIQGYSAVRFGSCLDATPDFVEPVKLLTARIKDRVGELKKQYCFSSEELTDAAGRTMTLARMLSDLLCEFDDRFRKAKLEAGMVDYTDVARAAYQLLIENGQPTAVAREISEGIDEIYIDEYQDVNRLQDEIFRAVSRDGGNLFMVGDVKQSIYGFRGSRPEIFTSYREKYPPYKGETVRQGEPASVFMQENFRCDKGVVELTNLLFGCLLGKGGGRFPYVAGDALAYAKDGGCVSPAEVAPRLCLCEAVPPEITDGDGNLISQKVPAHAEASFVADEIVRLLRSGKKKDGTPIRPGDIAILLRSDSRSAPAFLRELSRRGIPTNSRSKTSLFDTEEIRLILCLLNAIDNPHRDVYLTGALLSHVYRFSPDELAQIAAEEKKTASFYDALCRYTDAHDFEKGREFLRENDRYRMLSEQMPVGRLIRQLCDDTRLVETLCEKTSDAAARRGIRRNCNRFCEYARSFESGTFRGLYAFLSYINEMIRQNKTPDGGAEAADAVSVMSIHQAKGLEFPVCFVSSLEKPYSQKDTEAAMIYEPDIGIGMKLLYGDGYLRMDTPFRQAIVEYLRSCACEEELRILYVALTRARERLYLTAKCGTRNYSYTSFLKSAQEAATLFAPHEISSRRSYLSAILLALKEENADLPAEHLMISDEPEMPDGTDGEAPSVDPEDVARAEKLFSERFSYRYPHEDATAMRAKLSVSKLSPTVLDGTEDEAADMTRSDAGDRTDGPYLKEAPDFISGAGEPTAAEKGTATHLVMQFADPERLARYGAADEIARLLSCGFIDRRTAEIARVSDIDRFAAGEFCRRILASRRIWREFRFNLPMNASDFTADEEKKAALADETLLVQGVIDGFFFEGDRLILFDYKTDHPTDAERADPETARRTLEERHGEQLSYYRQALKKLFGREVDETYICSLPLGRAFRVLCE